MAAPCTHHPVYSLQAPVPPPPPFFPAVHTAVAQHPRVAAVQLQAPLLDGCVVADMLVRLTDGRDVVVELGAASSVLTGPGPTHWTPCTLLQRAALAAEGHTVVVPMAAQQVLTWQSMEDLLQCVHNALDNA